MRICLCIDKLGNGGAERVISILANQFSLMGHDVQLIETSTKQWCSFYKIEDSVKRIFLLDTFSKEGSLNKIKALKRCLDSIKPDVIISFKYQTNINVFLANLNLKIPHIVSERNNPFTYDIGISSKLFKKFIFRHSSGCVFQTDDARKFYFNKTTKKSVLIKNPVLLNRYSFKENVQRNNTILYVGRLDEQKNVKLLIDSFNTVFLKRNEFILKIYGCGKLEDDLKKYAQTLPCKNSIFFLGTSKTWHEDENGSFMFVLPSNYEGMPNSLMEAMCLQIPCIATDCPIGGPRALIKNDYNGLLVACNNHEALSSAMIELINNPKKGDLFAERNKNMIDEYSPESVANQWIDFIHKILRK